MCLRISVDHGIAVDRTPHFIVEVPQGRNVSTRRAAEDGAKQKVGMKENVDTKELRAADGEEGMRREKGGQGRWLSHMGCWRHR